MALYQILNGRFLQQVPYPQVYDAELPFVRNLEQALAQKQKNKTTYADILIEDCLKGGDQESTKIGSDGDNSRFQEVC